MQSPSRVPQREQMQGAARLIGGNILGGKGGKV